MTGALNPSNISATGSNGNVLTIVGGNTVWAAPSGGSLPSGLPNQILRHNGFGFAAVNEIATSNIANFSIPSSKFIAGANGTHLVSIAGVAAWQPIPTIWTISAFRGGSQAVVQGAAIQFPITDINQVGLTVTGSTLITGFTTGAYSVRIKGVLGLISGSPLLHIQMRDAVLPAVLDECQMAYGNTGNSVTDVFILERVISNTDVPNGLNVVFSLYNTGGGTIGFVSRATCTITKVQ